MKIDRPKIDVILTSSGTLSLGSNNLRTTGTGYFGAIEVTSSTGITNLNADMVDGKHASEFEATQVKGNMTASLPILLDQARQVIGGSVVVSHSTSTGYIHLPTAGTSNQLLKNSGASGTGTWGTVTENAGALANITTIGMSGVLTSTLPSGTAPFTIASSTGVTKLNADLLDGYHASYFQSALTTGNISATSPIAVDQTRQVIGGALTISHASTAGNIHLPTAGSSNQLLKNSGSSGTGAWGTVTENAGALSAVTTISMTGAITNNPATGIYSYKDAATYKNSTNETGTIKILLPVAFSEENIHQFKILLTDTRDNNRGAIIHCGGYASGSAGYWADSFAYCSNTGFVTSVRLATSGSYPCILLGTTAAVWGYVQVLVSEVVSTATGMGSGYTLSVIASESGITHIQSPTINSGLNADTLDTYQASNNTASIPISNTTLNTNLNADLLDGAHLSTSTGLGSSDVLISSQNAVKTYVDTNARSWILIPAANYTAAPASTSTITMGVDMTASVLVGMSLRYTISSVEYFGQVSAITSNLLTIRGASLGGNVSNLKYGGGTVTELHLPVNGYYEDASNSTLLLSDNRTPLLWEKRKSYAVFYKVWSRIHDSHITHGKASVYINGAELNSSAGGLTIAADATWYSTVIDINTSNYDILNGEAIEVTSTKGGAGDAIDLVVILIIVTP